MDSAHRWVQAGVVLAGLSLFSGLYGNYLQHEANRISLAQMQDMGKKDAPRNDQAAAAMISQSIVPSVLGWASPLAASGMLLLSVWIAFRKRKDDKRGDALGVVPANATSPVNTGAPILLLRNTSLDPPTTDPQIVYKKKVRAIFTNDSNEPIHVGVPSWIIDPHNVSAQTPLGYRYQVESTPDGWKRGAWNKQELTDAQIAAGASFTLYVGLDSLVPHNELEKHRMARTLGTLRIPVTIGGSKHLIEEQI